MKQTTKLLLTSLLAAGLFWSCTKKDEISKVAMDDLADDIASALGESNAGISDEIIEVTRLADEYHAGQAGLKSTDADTLYAIDTTFTRTNPRNTLIIYSYSYHAKYAFVFMNNHLNNIFYESAASGNFNAPRISSSEDRTSEWTLTGLELTSSSYVLNGTTDRTGDSESKVRNRSKVNSESGITVSNVTVDKSSLMITGGTLNWTISGDVNGEDFTYDITVIFEANGMAELTLNGITYSINIVSGEIVEE